jgi:hypothetical protein
VPEDRDVQVIPSGEVKIVPLSPTATNRVPDQVILRRVAFVTVNELVEVAVPPEVVTLMGPVELLMAGTIMTICALDVLVTVAETPFTLTVLPVVKFVPVMVTVVPGGPLVGVKPVIVGGVAPLLVLVGDWSHQLTAAGPQNFDANVMRLVQSL